MVLRRDGWRVIASAAACWAVAGAMSAAMAMDFGAAPVPPGDIPATTGGIAPTLQWGGPLPRAPRPGEVPVYVPSPSAYSARPQPQPQFAVPAETAPEPEAISATPQEIYAAPDESAEPLADPDMMPRRLYTPRDASEEELPPEGEGREAMIPEDEAGDGGGALPPLADPVTIDGEEGTSGYSAAPEADPWSGLTEVTPGALPPKRQARPAERPSYASLEERVPARRGPRPSEGGSILDRGRGALEDETPSGYQPMPRAETMCRRALAKLGVRFVDATSIRTSRSCGIDYPVKVTDISPGVAIRPAATLNCMAALRVAQWMEDEVMPAARWKLLKRPTVLINASSYRCSRIAGSRSISEHASGNALDVHGFKFSDGSYMEIEKKGFFEFRQKAFQRKVRESACRYFGTVLGPGYNEDHADHLHLDAKQRRRTVCK